MSVIGRLTIRLPCAVPFLIACLAAGAGLDFSAAAEPGQTKTETQGDAKKPDKVRPEWKLPEVEGWKHDKLKKIIPGRSDLAVDYETDTILASIYIYDAGYERIPSDLKPKLVQDHFRQVAGDIQTAVKLGVYKSASTVAEGEATLGSDKDAVKCLYGKYVIDRKTLRCSSTIHLTVKRDHFVKVRCTWPAGDDAKSE